ncbi:hypothetical protein QJS04_geneDACA003542 [Acorus gramineus]|uniref:Uncharacterized protein n=1 Tax=Acorus gramineus TaxID=55184 RepID=A0AAV9BKT9_ACOGR|nr:hypothetical protein QJS04_geneDACA003542 [Acorus gramineus]
MIDVHLKQILENITYLHYQMGCAFHHHFLVLHISCSCWRFEALQQTIDKLTLYLTYILSKYKTDLSGA